MMKFQKLIARILATAFISMIVLASFSQPLIIKQINSINNAPVALAPLRFLASDELMGRATARPEINIAARYISGQFKSMGLKEMQGTTDYFQTFDIQMVTPANSGTFTVNATSFQLGIDLLQMQGEDISLNAPIEYVGYGNKEDLDKADIKGKIIVSNIGLSDSTAFMDAFGLIDTKIKLAKELGAVALVERFKYTDVPWDALKRYLLSEHPKSEDTSHFPVYYVDDKNSNLPALIKEPGARGTINISGTQVKNIPAKNVMGWVEGTDPKLKSQFIVLSAHYDHLGVAKQPKMEEGKMDSIYNGARDNAIGTTAVMDAAGYFAKYPAKRSILFIAYTAEEIGEIGSKYFSAHPTIPLHHMVYNLNIDNASYNDTTIVSIVGLGRTSADADLKRACAAFGLTAMPDPAPEQNLFDRSDNVNLAVKGIPAPTFSLGIRKFDENITNRYHQLSDEVGNFNLNYAMKFINSYILAAKYIADNRQQPTWIKGDKYERAWKELYH
jgi:hypothetical protein